MDGRGVGRDKIDPLVWLIGTRTGKEISAAEKGGKLRDQARGSSAQVSYAEKRSVERSGGGDGHRR